MSRQKEEKTKPQCREERLMLLKEPSTVRMVQMELAEKVAPPPGVEREQSLTLS